MTTQPEHAPQPINSDELVKLVLANHFEVLKPHLDSSGATQEIIRIIHELPGEGVKVVAFIGGAASGKTTFTRRLAGTLAQAGVATDVIGTDDYVLGDRAYRREHFEGKAPKAKYDFGLMNQKIDDIRKNRTVGTTVSVPTYDQATGIAIAEGEENYTHKVGVVDVLIVEGDFPEMTHADALFYIHVPDEQRLANRLGRDTTQRSEADHAKIVENFNLRQQTQQGPYTLSAVPQADYILDVDASGADWQYSIYRAKAQ